MFRELYVPSTRKIEQVKWVHRWPEYPDDGLDAEFHERWDLPTYEVPLIEMDHEAARHYANLAATNHKPQSNYNDGINPNAMIDGKSGEIGFAALFGLSVDMKYRPGGDRIDFVLPLGTVDVKTETRGKTVGQIMRYDEKGRIKDLTADYYVFAFKDQCIVRIFGYITRQNVLHPNDKPRPITTGYSKYEDSGTHRNYEIQHHELSPITELGLSPIGVDTCRI